MSNLLRSIGRILAAWFSSESAPLDPDQMPLRDWADLPPHHPVCGRAPC